MKKIKKMLAVMGVSVGIIGPAMFGFAGCEPRVVKTFEEATNEYDAFLQKLENERNFTCDYEVYGNSTLILADDDKIKVSRSNSERETYYNSDGSIITYNSRKMIDLETNSDEYVKSLISELNNPSWKSYDSNKNELSGEIEALIFTVGEGEFKQEYYRTEPITASINETEAKIQNAELNYKFYDMGGTVVNIPEEYVEDIKKEKEKAEKENKKENSASNQASSALENASKQLSDAMAATYVMQDREIK